MPMFITFEVETDRVSTLRVLALNIARVKELASGSSLAELMNSIETAEIEAIKAKHAVAKEALGGGEVQLVRSGERV